MDYLKFDSFGKLLFSHILSDSEKMKQNLSVVFIILSHENKRRPNGAVVREAGCCTRGSVFESRVSHGCRAVRIWLHQ